jgi:hypothetical protein
MRTLLRKTPAALYFQGPDKWTNNPNEALNFNSIDRALRFIEQWHLKDVELAFSFGDEETVTAVDVDRLKLKYLAD